VITYSKITYTYHNITHHHKSSWKIYSIHLVSNPQLTVFGFLNCDLCDMKKSQTAKCFDAPPLPRFRRTSAAQIHHRPSPSTAISYHHCRCITHSKTTTFNMKAKSKVVKMKKVPIWSRFPSGPGSQLVQSQNGLYIRIKINLLPFHAKTA
jgi:hypothetical protein